MAKSKTILQVFIASPSDTAEERKVLDEVVDEFNLTWGDSNSIALELVKWETHSYPSMGDDAQDVINKQIGGTYDIFLGLMWGKFGTPTNRAESGTEEEFNTAYSRRVDNGENVQIAFYFKDAGIPPSKMDINQLQKVSDFKERLSDECGILYQQFKTIDEFTTKVRIHLPKITQDWLSQNDQSFQHSSAKEVKKFTKVDKTTPLANLAALDEQDCENGLLDLVETSNDFLEGLLKIVGRITEYTAELGGNFDKRSVEMNSLGEDQDNTKAFKRISGKASHDMEDYVRHLSTEIPEYETYSYGAMEAFGKVAMLLKNDFEVESEEIIELESSMDEFSGGLLGAMESLGSMRESIANLPRTTTKLNRSKKRLPLSWMTC